MSGTAEVGMVGAGITEIVIETQFVVLQDPSALTQYVVVTVGPGLMYNEEEYPEITNVPPHDTSYQFHFAPVPLIPPTTIRLSGAPPHILV